MIVNTKDVVRSLPDTLISKGGISKGGITPAKSVVVQNETPVGTTPIKSNEGFVGTTNTPADKPSNALEGGAQRGPLALRFAQISDAHTDRKRAVLTEIATHAVAHSMHAGKPDHPILEAFGESLGKALGVVVTEALALVPSWNTPVLDANGKPVVSVEGAERIGEHDILKRHQEVVGPKVTALVEKMAPGVIHDLLEGLGKGATVAPGLTYRLEVAWADALAKL